jgi:hypothetical protein
MMTTRLHSHSIISLLLTFFLFITPWSQKTHAITRDVWWDHDWTYRIPLQISETGIVSITLNFSEILNDLGLEDGLVDLRSLQLIPYSDGVPGEPIPFEETFSQLIIDADDLVIGSPPDAMYWMFLTESTTLGIDNVLKMQGNGSLHAHIEISEDTQATTGFYFDFNDSSTSNWTNFDLLLYDVYPDDHNTSPNEMPSIFNFQIYGLMGCPITYIDGPELTKADWNGISMPLQPFGLCDFPDYSSIDALRFIFERGSNSYLEIGDTLDLWVDNFRLFDQDADGQIIWNAEENVDRYYLYFNLLNDLETPTSSPIFLPLIIR